MSDFSTFSKALGKKTRELAERNNDFKNSWETLHRIMSAWGQEAQRGVYAFDYRRNGSEFYFETHGWTVVLTRHI